jgi:DNA-binding response OmpR family regulator
MLPPALILLDVVVPYVNGFELLVALRRNPDWQHIPIIMVSADYYEPDIQRALTEGANAYVVKTPGLQDLLQAVRQILPSPTTEGPRGSDQVCVEAATPTPRKRRDSERRHSPRRNRAA